MTSPNFFIIGAPKSGTTSLVHYLNEHPNVYIPSVKEIYFFNTDSPGKKIIQTFEQYLHLFKGAEKKHTAIGDASVMYLYSSEALVNIKKFDPNAKIIVMLRDPKRMVVSLHKQLIHALVEDEDDFKKAWYLQKSRSRGVAIPRLCRDPNWLQYSQLGCYSSYLEQVFNIFPSENIKVIIFDEFCKDIEKIYGETLEFLGLERISMQPFSIFNPQQEFSSKLSQKIAQNSPVWIRDLVTKLRFSDRFNWVASILDWLFKKKTKSAIRSFDLLNPSFQEFLSDFFEDDIKKVSKLIGKDLNVLWTDRCR